jgi:protein-S-isoprenylcysteine O-methyltransferase Ste14
VFRTVRSFFGGTPRRTFVLYPALVILVATLRNGNPAPRRWPPLLLLPWGYLQYYLTGKYRERERAGPRGYSVPPDRLLTTGPYALTRNPMYLGHLIFLSGLALAWRSRLGWLILVVSVPWFHARVLRDEKRLLAKFGAEYDDYCRRVRRWIPLVL